MLIRKLHCVGFTHYCNRTKKTMILWMCTFNGSPTIESAHSQDHSGFSFFLFLLYCSNPMKMNSSLSLLSSSSSEEDSFYSFEYKFFFFLKNFPLSVSQFFPLLPLASSALLLFEFLYGHFEAKWPISPQLKHLKGSLPFYFPVPHCSLFEKWASSSSSELQTELVLCLCAFLEVLNAASPFVGLSDSVLIS